MIEQSINVKKITLKFCFLVSMTFWKCRFKIFHCRSRSSSHMLWKSAHNSVANIKLYACTVKIRFLFSSNDGLHYVYCNARVKNHLLSDLLLLYQTAFTFNIFSLTKNPVLIRNINFLHAYYSRFLA